VKYSKRKKSLKVSRYNFKSITSSNFSTSLAATIFSKRSLLNGERWATGMDPGLWKNRGNVIPFRTWFHVISRKHLIQNLFSSKWNYGHSLCLITHYYSKQECTNSRGLNFVWWRLTVVGLQYRIFFRSPFWHQAFRFLEYVFPHGSEANLSDCTLFVVMHH